MYPFVRMAKELYLYRNATALPLFATHVSSHMCWPWDIDLWRELNNGRTLTLFDLGRIPLARRMGLGPVLRRKNWGLTVAGVSVRYRRRVRVFQKIDMRSRAIGWDDRFLYFEQSMWTRQGECTTHALYRTAVTGPGGIVEPAMLIQELGQDVPQPQLPAWVQAWISAEQARPWPPEMT